MTSIVEAPEDLKSGQLYQSYFQIKDEQKSKPNEPWWEDYVCTLRFDPTYFGDVHKADVWRGRYCGTRLLSDIKNQLHHNIKDFESSECNAWKWDEKRSTNKSEVRNRGKSTCVTYREFNTPNS